MATESDCECAEAHFTDEVGVRTRRIFPMAHRKHDCEYIKARNQLLPMARELADRESGGAPVGGHRFSTFFHQAMNKLTKDL